MILVHVKWLMHRIQNVTRVGSANLGMACEMLQLTSTQLGIEMQVQLARCIEPGACNTDE